MFRTGLSIALALAVAIRTHADDKSPPPDIVIDMCIAEVIHASEIAKPDAGATNDTTANRSPAPDMHKDGKAWLAWAEKNHRIQPISRPIIRTQPNQQATIQIGQQVPLITADGRVADRDPNAIAVGVTVAVTPRISPKGLIIMEVDVKHDSMVHWDGVDGPIHQQTTAKTTISAEGGKTIILGGLKHFAVTDGRSVIIAFSPHGTAKR